MAINPSSWPFRLVKTNPSNSYTCVWVARSARPLESGAPERRSVGAGLVGEWVGDDVGEGSAGTCVCVSEVRGKEEEEGEGGSTGM